MPADTPSLLAALAAEIGDVRSGVDRVSGLLTDLVRRLPVEHRAEALTDAQALDVLIQRLDAVAGVLNGLASGQTSTDAVSSVLLADMAGRLNGHDAARPPDGAGDLHLFD
ncbi:hypothetical protein [Brevundimonas sp. FT23042]|uniref:hypothetical protein n=1 Tax=Brevundimonas sp. FT23042 TaxID=3393749 RepID=UPI003B58B117